MILNLNIKILCLMMKAIDWSKIPSLELMI